MRMTAWTAALVATLLLPLAVSAAAQAAPAYTYQGTVHTLDTTTGTLELITGVGMSLRLVSIQTTTATHVASGRTTLALRALKPGDVIRAECHATPKGPVADLIERIALP